MDKVFIIIYQIKNVKCYITSRKHGKKEPQSFVHCGSFDHLDMHSLNDYKLGFFVYQLKF
jgi:hypothetical protein